MPQAPQKYTQLVFAVMMSCLMAFIVTCVVTLVNTGPSANFVSRWLHAFVIAWPIACSCIFLFAGRVRRIATALTEH